MWGRFIFVFVIFFFFLFCQHIKMFVRWRNLQMNRSIMLSPDDVLPCPDMSRHVRACYGPQPRPAAHSTPCPIACPATTTATTLYRLLFIYYLFDMLGVVAGKEVEEDGGGGWRWRYCPGRAFCQLVLGLLIFSTLLSLSLSFWGSLFIYLFIIIVMLCISFLNLYSII